MVRRAGVPKAGNSSLSGGATSRLRVAIKRGLYVFGAFFAVAVGFYVLTFMWFRRLDGPMDLPLPEWIMILPTLVSLGAGVITSLIVMVVDLIRGRPPHRD
ncbi:hypothetical protein [Stackebrandtia soli]|uniref:hypothetical protein n=1 Tax=Stackebrandtia soli TaxID=1892856 RepID=UPI0039EA7D02